MNRIYKKTSNSQLCRKERELNHKCFVSWFINQVLDCDNTGVLFSDMKKKAPSTSNTIIHLARFMLRNFNIEIFSLNRKYYVSNENNIFKNNPPFGCKKIKTSLDIETIKCVAGDIHSFVKEYPFSKTIDSNPDVFLKTDTRTLSSEKEISKVSEFDSIFGNKFGEPTIDSIFGTPVSDFGDESNLKITPERQDQCRTFWNFESTKTVPLVFNTPTTMMSPPTMFDLMSPPMMSFDTPMSPPTMMSRVFEKEVSVANFLESIDNVFEPTVSDKKYFDWLFEFS